MTAERVLMGLLLGGIGIGCVQVLYPFFSAILWAAILTYTAWPMTGCAPASRSATWPRRSRWC